MAEDKKLEKQDQNVELEPPSIVVEDVSECQCRLGTIAAHEERATLTSTDSCSKRWMFPRKRHHEGPSF
ncbi:hypothetical protein JHK86_044402 [Glycine max]|nr:hypothetical protein JHK86_044402 [Glycine max]